MKKTGRLVRNVAFFTLVLAWYTHAQSPPIIGTPSTVVQFDVYVGAQNRNTWGSSVVFDAKPGGDPHTLGVPNGAFTPTCCGKTDDAGRFTTYLLNTDVAGIYHVNEKGLFGQIAAAYGGNPQENPVPPQTPTDFHPGFQSLNGEIDMKILVTFCISTASCPNALPPRLTALPSIPIEGIRPDAGQRTRFAPPHKDYIPRSYPVSHGTRLHNL
jgi:hypothetical protein